ncbi:unnamed protein product [Peronospora belbahrii]|uniref:Palmitoyltransferase n=1 Tax=Peronospora belbahrii TaxID=622444 RepID=A0AAU9KYQ7_9STRA|nr:unnamed protein product [Peronospora belbahrii]
MDVIYNDQTAFDAAANGDFPLVVLLWGMAMAVQPVPVDLLVAQDKCGNTLIHYTAAGEEDTCDTMHFLIQQIQASNRRKELMDAKNDEGETPLIRAAHAGNMRIADTLLRSGYVDLLAQDARGNSAAHHAAAQGHLGMLHFLLEAEKKWNEAPLKKKQEVKQTKPGGYSLQRRNVLHYACMSEYKPMVQYLLIRDFDAAEADAKGTTCLDIAKQRKLLWLEQLLTDKDKASDPPTHIRKTRGIAAIFHGVLLLAILVTSYWLVWWLALPLIVVALGISLLAFHQMNHSHGGHSHGAALKNFASMHPSKRNVHVAMNVSLEQKEEGCKDVMTAWNTTDRDKRSVVLHALTRAQPESAMGIWIAWVGLFTMLYIVLWVDPTYANFVDSHTVLLSITGVMEASLLMVWVRLAFLCPIDPGRVSTYEHDVKAMLDKASRAELPDTTKFCRTCLVMKPIRSKHCAQCGICIARYDHHCAWINRCVGYSNHRLFFFFVLLHCVALGFFATLTMIVLADATYDFHAERVRATVSGNNDSLSAMDIWVEIPSLLSMHLLVVMVMVVSFATFVALAMMLYQHIINIAKNLTINEQMNWRRYAYMTQKPASSSIVSESSKHSASETMSNPFDRGVKMNVLEFFFRSGVYAVDYYKVFNVSARDFSYSSQVSISAEEMAESLDTARDNNDFNDCV